MKYFITGATGFLGASLARQLRKEGHEVVALVRDLNKASALKAIGASIIKGDITEKESMRTAMKGCDGVYHAAAWYKIGAKDKLPAQKINVEGTRNVLELMKELHIPKGVYTSTLAINSNTNGMLRDESFHFSGKHISEYDKTKAAAHQVAEQFIKEGLPLVIVMPGLIYGPDGTSMSDDALRLYLKKKLPLIPSQSAYSWAHVEDVARAHILAMEKAAPGSKYIICGPSHTFSEGLDIATKITGIRKPIVVPPVMLKITAFFSLLVERFIPLPEMYRSEALRVQAGMTYLGDNSKAKRELGYDPRSLEVGLKQTLEYELDKIKRNKEK
ncbi:MAG TPA: NAD-dependent epimerase/dehydratase family protein [Chitinophagaceae bacterium]|nr:NAD-dependent epimerase/dehydratase family protein [Chitinophagaceae bacterium]